MLEPYDGKLSRTVLRREGGGNTANPADYMVSSFRSFLNGQMRAIFQKCTDAAEKEIPKELLADHYSNTLFLVWQWSALKDVSCTKETGRRYLQMLLSKIG